MTLEFARSLEVEPGSNPRGEQADTTWLFLVPSLDVEEIAVMGHVPAATRVALQALCDRIVELDQASAPGLVYLGRGAAARAARSNPAIAMLRAAIEAGGAVYASPSRDGNLELARRLGIEIGVTVGAGAGGPGGAVRAPAAWLVPAPPAEAPRWARPAMRSVARAGRLLSRALGRAAARSGPRVSEADQALGVERVGALGEPARSTGLLLRATPEATPGELPRYLQLCAEAAGVPLDPAAWRIAPPRGYRSQKVIFFARSRAGEELVVKLTQDGRFNRLLENEATALEALAGRDVGGRVEAPRVRFRSHHAGLAVVAEDALSGRAFTEVSRSGPDCEHARAVCEALTQFGAATAHDDGMGEALAEIVGSYLRLYAPSPEVRGALLADVGLLGEGGGRPPAVFLHGDATVFNVLITESRRVGLVDWENAERSGPPLWDLFHFLQAHGAWTAERAAARYTPARFRAQFLEGDGLDPLHGEAVSAYVADLGLADEWVPALLRTWLARHAVREARQLPPNRLESGLYHRLLPEAL